MKKSRFPDSLVLIFAIIILAQLARAILMLLLIRNIENEFEHNLSQQIYMTDECWNVIKAAKNATIQAIRKTSMSESDSADKLREDLLSDTMEKASPSATALSYVKKEIGALW